MLAGSGLKKRRAAAAVLSLITALLLSSCGGSSGRSSGTEMAAADSVAEKAAGNAFNTAAYSSYDAPMAEEAAYEDYEYDAEEAEYQAPEAQTSSVEPGPGTPASSGNIVLTEEKLVYRCNMRIETMSYNEAYPKFMELVSAHNGIIQSENFSDYRKQSYSDFLVENYITVRIPSSRYKAFVDSVGGIGNVTSKDTSVDNITQRYYDKQIRAEALQEEMARLKDLLGQCTEVSDMIEINHQMTEVQNEIDSLKTEIRTMDMDTAYSYVTVDLAEVRTYTQEDPPEVTFMQRLQNTVDNAKAGWLNFLENLLFFCITFSPVILLAVIIIIIMAVYSKKHPRRRAPRPAKAMNVPARTGAGQETVQKGRPGRVVPGKEAKIPDGKKPWENKDNKDETGEKADDKAAGEAGSGKDGGGEAGNK